MKTALPEDEFWAVVTEYNRYLREGGEFDSDVVEFGYWRRARGIEERPWGRDWRRGGSAMPRWRGGGLAGAGQEKVK